MGILRSTRKELRVKLALPMICSGNCQDIVVIQRVERTAIIVDVTILLEKGLDTFNAAGQLKTDDYAAEAVIFSQRGFRVATDVFVLKGLGSWDPQNCSVLWLSGVWLRYLSLLNKLVIGVILQISSLNGSICISFLELEIY
ncbi:unnamed protein product [Soboliphyme baturini]|uniref:Pentatricopeptide repeat-containing protein n=1 Tax=Soboliphyme baturini TaxID=241478 RepID=A0A183J2N2_9BILA|nr:unnamed protein product [Soboliphyme baturini]